MPRTGTPAARTCGSHFGACGSYTELGPPLRTMPAGANSLIFSKDELHGSTAEKTCCSRMRRAISCVYWPPKSRTTTPPRSELGLGSCVCMVAPVDIVASLSLPVAAPGDRAGLTLQQNGFLAALAMTVIALTAES